MVVPSSVDESGTVIAEVYVQKGAATGRNVGLSVIASGGGVVSDKANAPTLYRVADDEGIAVRKRATELAETRGKKQPPGQ